MSAPHSMPMVVNNINLLTMVKPAFVFMYQVDPNTPKYDKEQLILINKQHSWQQVQSIASVRLDSTWVKIKFTDISKKLISFLKIKEFTKYKTISPKNINEIIKLNNYVRIKINSKGI